ncbi:MAG: enoyl-CoA hydratase/isomerase family protein [Alphaproteobacteria bacterium]
MNQGISEDLITELKNGQGIITLNRPPALNALSLSMIEGITAQLDIWEQDRDVKTVLFRGADERAFCAGGDMKTVYHALLRGEDATGYFRAEYNLNRCIFNYPKPTAARMDGIVMGGGYGIGGNCQTRIVTEKTIFAMPETSIGFFSDVGSMYHLTRAPHHIGRYLALTGERLTGGDMIFAGLADEGVAEKSMLFAHVEKIEKTFASETLLEIFSALKSDSSEWGQDTHAMLLKKSPLSLAVTNEHYNRARGRDFNYVIETDFILAQKFLESPDLREGIRAVLVDKDHAPQWRESPDNQAVAACFAPANLPL